MELYVVCHNETFVDEGDATYPIAVFDSYDKVEKFVKAEGFPDYDERCKEYRPKKEDWYKGRKLEAQFLTVTKLTLNKVEK